MTRINVVPVSILSNAHLMAEYKEITRPFNKVAKRIAKGQVASDVKISPVYLLNSGHETFFFDKLQYLHVRYIELYEELIGRGYNLSLDNFNVCEAMMSGFYGTTWYGDYKPTHEAIYLNMARLAKRSNMQDTLAELDYE